MKLRNVFYIICAAIALMLTIKLGVYGWQHPDLTQRRIFLTYPLQNIIAILLWGVAYFGLINRDNK